MRKGQHHTLEAKAKLRLANLGKIVPNEIRMKIRLAMIGNKNHFFGKHHTKESRLKISKVHKGKKLSEKQRIKLLMSRLGKKLSKKACINIGLAKMREKNPNWKGSNASNNAGNLRARRWFGDIQKKSYCKCGKRSVHIHHKDKNTLNNDIKNLAFLCAKCHGKAHRILNKKEKLLILRRKK